MTYANWNVWNRTVSAFKLCVNKWLMLIEMFEIELFHHLIVCKQMTYAYWNVWNRTVSSFNCV